MTSRSPDTKRSDETGSTRQGARRLPPRAGRGRRLEAEARTQRQEAEDERLPGANASSRFRCSARSSRSSAPVFRAIAGQSRPPHHRDDPGEYNKLKQINAALAALEETITTMNPSASLTAPAPAKSAAAPRSRQAH